MKLNLEKINARKTKTIKDLHPFSSFLINKSPQYFPFTHRSFTEYCLKFRLFKFTKKKIKIESITIRCLI